jgi:hypothetical protein
MQDKLIQLRYNRKGYDIGKDGRFQPENMILIRRDGSSHRFTEEMNEMLQTLTHEFLRDFARSISTDELTAEPMLLEYSSREIREQFIEPATIALIQQWGIQNKELVQELLVRASLRRYQLVDSRNSTWGRRFVAGVNDFIEEVAEHYG